MKISPNSNIQKRNTETHFPTKWQNLVYYLFTYFSSVFLKHFCKRRKNYLHDFLIALGFTYCIYKYQQTTKSANINMASRNISGNIDDHDDSDQEVTSLTGEVRQYRGPTRSVNYGDRMPYRPGTFATKSNLIIGYQFF